MLSASASSAKSATVAVAHDLVGWALCGATMALGMKYSTLRIALTIHALATAKGHGRCVRPCRSVGHWVRKWNWRITRPVNISLT